MNHNSKVVMHIKSYEVVISWFCVERWEIEYYKNISCAWMGIIFERVEFEVGGWGGPITTTCIYGVGSVQALSWM
jgi:hypothetical protein